MLCSQASKSRMLPRVSMRVKSGDRFFRIQSKSLFHVATCRSQLSCRSCSSSVMAVAPHSLQVQLAKLFLVIRLGGDGGRNEEQRQAGRQAGVGSLGGYLLVCTST